MIAEIRDNIHVYLTHITTYEEDVLWREFSVSANTKYIDPTQMTHWDGVFRKYNKLKKRIARPLLDYLLKVCEKNKLPIDVVDKRDQWQYDILEKTCIQNDFLPGITLADYQVSAIHTALDHECGLIVFPTGGGKTEALSGICKAIECPTVILADQTIVIDQIKSRLELRQVSDEVGLFYAGKKPSGQLIVVGSIQSLAPIRKVPHYPKHTNGESDSAYQKRVASWEKKVQAFETRKNNAKKLLEYVKSAEMIIVDEADRCTSDMWKHLFRHSVKARRRYGFTGTPFDKSKPVEALVLQEHLGSIIVNESRQTLTDLGRIIPCHYYMIAMGLDGSISDGTAYDIAYDEQMTNNNKFYEMLSGIAKKYTTGSHGTLVIVEREAIGLRLNQLMLEMGLKSEFVYGKSSKQQRDQAFRAFEKRDLNVLIGGKIINRGLDLSGGCENLIIGTGGKLRSEFLQKVGRALRLNSVGKSRIFDILWRNNRYLYSHSKERLNCILDAGYEATIILPRGKMSGRDFVNGRYRIPKQYL